MTANVTERPHWPPTVTVTTNPTLAIYPNTVSMPVNGQQTFQAQETAAQSTLQQAQSNLASLNGQIAVRVPSTVPTNTLPYRSQHRIAA